MKTDDYICGTNIFNITAMKRTIAITLAVFCVFLSVSATEKDYVKTVQKYDVPEEVLWLESPTPSQFWNSLLFNDWQLRKFNVEMRKDKGLEKRAEDIYNSLPHFYPQYAEYVDHSRDSFCNELASEVGLDGLNVPFGLYVVNSDIMDVFSAPMEDGFAICLTSSLVDNPKVTRDMLKGYVAREFAHGALKHTQREIYQQGWYRRNLGWASLASQFTNALMNEWLLDSGRGSDNGANRVVVNFVTAKENDRIQKEYKELEKFYTLKYNKGQNVQADLVALRFMQTQGNPEAYIDALRLLASRHDFIDGDNDTPSVLAERINLLKYVKDNSDKPELVNTSNRKLKTKAKLVEDARSEKEAYEAAMTAK